MMNPFYMKIDKTGSTPYVLIDEANNLMKFDGESFHENTLEFFRDIIDWLDKYLSHKHEPFTFECALNYFNSSTSKILFDMLEKMNDSVESNGEITVNWYVRRGNDLMHELHEDLVEDFNNLKVVLIEMEVF